MIDWIVSFSKDTFMFNSVLGIVLYWVPLSLCVVGYTLRTIRNYRGDINERKIEEHYYPTDTIGDIIGRTIVTIIPLGNLWAGLFDIGPDMFGDFFKIIGKIFDQPLVPKKKEKK